MKIIVNGEMVDISGRTLAEALDELGYAAAQIATAVNAEFVARGQRSARELSAGDRIEIVTPRQGG